MSNFAPKRTSYDTGDSRWLRNALQADTHEVTIDGDLFPTGTFPGGLIKSGTFIARTTAGDKDAGPYSDAATDGRTTAVGLLRNDVVVKPGERHLVAVVHGGTVDRRFLPTNSGRDTAGEGNLTAIAFIN